MTYALFLGCKIPYYLAHYGTSTRAILKALDVDCVDIEFNCCGYPTRMLDADAYLFSAARNFALAEARGLDILTPCKCCFGSLQHARHWSQEQPDLKARINRLLAEEGLHWTGTANVRHLLSVLIHDVGPDAIAAKVRRPYKGLKIAPHYGCHALRPSKVTRFDDPLAPSIFEKLIDLTGAQSVQWNKRLECCGNPLWEKNSSLSVALMNQKLADAKLSGANYLCVACTYCQIQFDAVQHLQAAQNGNGLKLASILYPQLLGMSLGCDAATLGLDQNKLDIGGIENFLDQSKSLADDGPALTRTL